MDQYYLHFYFCLVIIVFGIIFVVSLLDKV